MAQNSLAVNDQRKRERAFSVCKDERIKKEKPSDQAAMDQPNWRPVPLKASFLFWDRTQINMPEDDNKCYKMKKRELLFMHFSFQKNLVQIAALSYAKLMSRIGSWMNSQIKAVKSFQSFTSSWESNRVKEMSLSLIYSTTPSSSHLPCHLI